MDHQLTGLDQSDLFKNKTLDEIDALLDGIRYRIKGFKRNEIIFSPDMAADTLGILLSGRAHAQKLFPNGKMVIIDKKEAPDLLAAPALFAHAPHYPATLAARTPCRVLTLHRDELVTLFAQDREIMVNFLASVSNAMITLKEKIANLSLNGIQERIADFLLRSARQNRSLTIELPFSKKDWAEYMNVSRPSLSRELAKLAAEDIIAVHKRTILIKDEPGLGRILMG